MYLSKIEKKEKRKKREKNKEKDSLYWHSVCKKEKKMEDIID